MDGHLGCFQLFILTVCLTVPIAVSCRISPSAPFYAKLTQRCLKEGGRERREKRRRRGQNNGLWASKEVPLRS